MIYLVIVTVGLILSLERMWRRYRFQDEYAIYIEEVIEMLVDIKNTLTTIIIDIGYKLLYIFSICQIKMNKAVNLIAPYVKCIKKYLKDKGFIEEVNLIMDIIDKNGNVVKSIIPGQDDKMCCELNILDLYFDKEKHMGILFNDKNEKTDCVNKIFHEKIPSTADYKLSKITFLMVELEYNEKKYRIELKNNMSNYYIVNNSLDQNFFKYYLNTVLNVPINEDNFYYIVTIIDQNVNFITLLHNQYLIFNEDNYDILPTLDPISTYTTETNDTPINEEQSNSNSNSDSDKSDDFVKLETDI